MNAEEFSDSMKGVDLPELLYFMNQRSDTGVGYLLLDIKGRIAMIDEVCDCYRFYSFL